METIEKVKGLVIPGGLLHAHVHLDKCYLLEKTPVGDGSFNEALEKTTKAKAEFTSADLIERGSKLIVNSLQYGVLTLRAFVEIDPTVGLKCLEAGLELQRRYQKHCNIHLVVFAQDPIFYPKDSTKQTKMSELLEQACMMTGHDTVLGSTPYVESNYDGQCANIRYLFDLADKYNRNVDFHLDYNLDKDQKPLVWYLLEEAHRRKWNRRIIIGHATRLSLFDEDEWDRLAQHCQGLKVAFVALPTSDLYMQGRQEHYKNRSRATLPLLELQGRGISCALAVNNVANLFTPQGDGDPLALLPLVVGLWQSATPEHLSALLSMVSSTAVSATMGKGESESNVKPQVAQVSIASNGIATLDVDIGTLDYTLVVDCDSIQQAVLSPSPARLAVKNGYVVARKTVNASIAP